MKKCCSFIFFAMVFLVTYGQGIPPRWINSTGRTAFYPPETYFTGFVEGNIRVDETLEQAKKRLQKEAQGLLAEGIRVKVNSETNSISRSSKINHSEQMEASFQSTVTTDANAEVVGIKTDSYYDQEENVVYAFAYANRYELTGYYKSNLSTNITQAKGLLQTAQDLEASGEKAKARQQCEAVNPLFEKIRYAQDLLTAIDATIAGEDLQQAKTEQLYNMFTQMSARLAQAVYVYVESKEDLFGQKVNIVANKLKAELAVNGCSFVENPVQADFRLKIKVSTRTTSNQGGIAFCYADASVELYDIHKQKVVFGDEISQKGGSNSQDKAGRAAMNDVAIQIAEKLKTWIE